MNIYLLGHNGYIGSKFVKYFTLNSIKFIRLGREDIFNLSLFLKKGDVLLNCAGYVGRPTVTECENHKLECLESNVILPGKLSKACQETETVLAHISTGCIYHGYEKHFTEEDAPNFSFRQNNCSFYSGSKALAEEILEDNKDSYLFRIRIPFDSEIDNPRNNLYKQIKYPKLFNSINSVSNLDEFVNCCYKIIADRHAFGKYNILNENPIYSKDTINLLIKYGLTTEKEWFENSGEFSTNIVVPRSQCILSTDKIKKIGLQLKDTSSSIEECIIKYLKK